MSNYVSLDFSDKILMKSGGVRGHSRSWWDTEGDRGDSPFRGDKRVGGHPFLDERVESTLFSAKQKTIWSFRAFLTTFLASDDTKTLISHSNRLFKTIFHNFCLFSTILVDFSHRVFSQGG
jgi:hypothetical protein